MTTDMQVDGRLARGQATRETLRQAAIECLAARGYAGTTTAEISLRAGVSTGLFTRHWPTKIALIADAAAHAQRAGFERLVARWQGPGAVSATRDAPQEFELLIDLFEEPEMRCLAELEVAARTDPDLQAALAPVLVELDRFITDGARQVSDPSVIGHDFDERVRFVIDVARGLSLRTATMTPTEAASARDETLRLLADFTRRTA